MDIKEALLQLNYAAENAHRRYLTFGYGHIMLYNEKAEEAADYVAAKYPKKISAYPLIEAEACGSDRKPKDVADDIIDRRSEWVAVCAKIEKIRFKAKHDLQKPQADIVEIVQKTIKDFEEI